MSGVLLEARNLSKEFDAGKGRAVHAVSEVSLQIKEGETFGLVGESGCGKSTLGRLLIDVLKPTSGEVYLRGENIRALSKKDAQHMRRELQLIFQDPYASLNPWMTVRDLIAEPLVTYHLYPTREETTNRVLELMQAVGVPGEFLYRYPHQFSGGQRQRIGIARALALNPTLVVCDEPVSALDVSVQNQILNLLQELQKKQHLTYLFISHDLSVIRHISDRVGVMFLGKICELGDTREVFMHPRHPYTRFLLNAIPRPDPRQRQDLPLLSGELPSPVNPPSGCRFHTRCPFAGRQCREQEPPLREIGSSLIACHHPLE